MPLEHKKKPFSCEGGQQLEQVVQAGCGVSVCGDIQNQLDNVLSNLLCLTLLSTEGLDPTPSGGLFQLQRSGNSVSNWQVCKERVQKTNDSEKIISCTCAFKTLFEERKSTEFLFSISDFFACLFVLQYLRSLHSDRCLTSQFLSSPLKLQS